MYVIEITSLRGRYEAKGDAWNVEAGDQYKPAPVNLLQRTVRMARALQAYIERQGVKVPVLIEPVLIAGAPGLHIESERPAIKVMMIDGIKSFVSGLATGKPALRSEQVYDLTERILNPRVKREPLAPPPDLAPEPEAEAPAAWEQNWQEAPVQQNPEPSRARAIFDASAEARSFDPNNYDFALAEDDAAIQSMPRPQRTTSPAKPTRRGKPRQQKILGMTPVQLAVIAALGVALICILAGLAYVVTTL
jgi:hypothetical protein